MNIAPLTYNQRCVMIERLAEGLTERSKDVMHFTLSDGHLRTIWADLYKGEPLPPAFVEACSGAVSAPEVRRSQTAATAILKEAA